MASSPDKHRHVAEANEHLRLALIDLHGFSIDPRDHPTLTTRIVGCFTSSKALVQQIQGEVPELMMPRPAMTTEDIQACIQLIPERFRVRCCEGGGPEDPAKSLAISISKLANAREHEQGLAFAQASTHFEPITATTPMAPPLTPQQIIQKAVDHPDHYTQGGIECIDAIEAALGPEGFIAYCRGCQIKYNWRTGLKDDAEQEQKKSAWYANRAAKTAAKQKEEKR